MMLRYCDGLRASSLSHPASLSDVGVSHRSARTCLHMRGPLSRDREQSRSAWLARAKPAVDYCSNQETASHCHLCKVYVPAWMFEGTENIAHFRFTQVPMTRHPKVLDVMRAASEHKVEWERSCE